MISGDGEWIPKAAAASSGGALPILHPSLDWSWRCANHSPSNSTPPFICAMAELWFPWRQSKHIIYKDVRRVVLRSRLPSEMEIRIWVIALIYSIIAFMCLFKACIESNPEALETCIVISRALTAMIACLTAPLCWLASKISRFHTVSPHRRL